MDVLDRIYEKLDKVENEVTQTRLSQVKIQAYIRQNTKDLSEHIKRTRLLEDALQKHSDDPTKHRTPITWVDIGKFLAAGSSLCAILYTIYKLYGVFNG